MRNALRYFLFTSLVFGIAALFSLKLEAQGANPRPPVTNAKPQPKPKSALPTKISSAQKDSLKSTTPSKESSTEKQVVNKPEEKKVYNYTIDSVIEMGANYPGMYKVTFKNMPSFEEIEASTLKPILDHERPNKDYTALAGVNITSEFDKANCALDEYRIKCIYSLAGREEYATPTDDEIYQQIADSFAKGECPDFYNIINETVTYESKNVDICTFDGAIDKIFNNSTPRKISAEWIAKFDTMLSNASKGTVTIDKESIGKLDNEKFADGLFCDNGACMKIKEGSKEKFMFRAVPDTFLCKKIGAAGK